MTEQEARKHFGIRPNDRISVSGLQETMKSAKRVLQRSQSRTDRLEAERDIRACEALIASPAFIVDFSFIFID